MAKSHSNFTVALRRAIGLLIIAAAVFFANVATAQNLVSNGDFEVGPFFTRGAVTGWIVDGTGNVAAVSGEGATSGTHAAALDEGGNSAGNTLAQTISTTPGVTYIFEFDSGVFGQPASAPQLRFEVFGNTSRLDETMSVPVINSFDPAQTEFHHYFRTFVADSNSTTIRFTDVGLGNANADLMIDAVSLIVAPPPTPAPTPAVLPLANGDFETWPFNNPGTVAGWVVGGNKHIETISQGASSPIHSAGFSVGGDSFNNVLSQTFITTAGMTYTLDFDAGVFGIRGGAPLQIQAQIIGSSPLFSANVTPPDNGATHPASVIFQHYHFAFIAGGSVATIQFTDLVGNNMGADLMLDTVVIAPQPPTFLQWQTSNFTPAQRGDPNVSGWSADPDGDGIRNGLEYYFHSNPLNGVSISDQPLLPQVGLMVDGTSTYVTFSYHRLLGWTGNAPAVAVSDDLVSWDLTQSQIEQVGSAGRADGFTDILTVRLKTPISGGTVPKKYFRLMLSQ
ncbi:MAG: hypothetical protein ACJ8M1_03155 [Chthoniobacterales bacterium]